MQRYDNYSPSGVAWLGDIPSSWECKKIGSLFSQRKTKVSDKDYVPLSVSKGGIVPQLDTAVKTDAGDNRKLVKTGDFVINSRSDRKGSCGISPLDGSVIFDKHCTGTKTALEQQVHSLFNEKSNLF